MPQDCPDLLTCAARNGKLKRLDGRLVPSAGPTASHPVHGGGATDGTRRRRHGYSLYRRAVEFSRITRAWSNSCPRAAAYAIRGNGAGYFSPYLLGTYYKKERSPSHGTTDTPNVGKKTVPSGPGSPRGYNIFSIYNK